MRAIDWLFKRVVKVRLEGPIDLQIQQKILQQLNQVKPSNSRALVLIINSYGGSLRAAKNISQALHALQSKKIPVYCFAEQFCLNSANIILTSSTQCFANKLSIIGDFGYVYDHYSFDQFSQKFNVGFQRLSLNSPKIDTFAKHYQLNNPQFIQKWLEGSAVELREQILSNRRQKIYHKSLPAALLESKILEGGSLVPADAEKVGLIDGLQTCEQFIRQNLSGFRVKQEKEYKEYRAINFLRNTLQIFKQQ